MPPLSAPAAPRVRVDMHWGRVAVRVLCPADRMACCCCYITLACALTPDSALTRCVGCLLVGGSRCRHVQSVASYAAPAVPVGELRACQAACVDWPWRPVGDTPDYYLQRHSTSQQHASLQLMQPASSIAGVRAAATALARALQARRIVLRRRQPAVAHNHNSLR